MSLNGRFLINTGRLQPIHRDHVEFWEKILEQHPKNKLIICLLKNPLKSKFDSHYSGEESTYLKMSKWTHKPENNPLPNWERYQLVKKAICNKNFLKNRTDIIFRDRPDLGWERSIQNLPMNRTWVFNKVKSKFDSSKIKFYKEKNEECLVINKKTTFSGKEIREKLFDGYEELSFLPKGCHKYFKENCLKYFRRNYG